MSVLLFIRADIRVPLPVIGRHGALALIVLVAALSVAMLAALRALALAPRTRNALAKRLLRSTRVRGQPVPMRGLLALIPWSAASWLCSSLAFFVVLIGLHPVVAGKPVTVIGALALAAILGNLAFFVPAGLGVRDGILITLLVTSTGVPVGSVAITVVAMRALDPITKSGLLLALGLGHRIHRGAPSARANDTSPAADGAGSAPEAPGAGIGDAPGAAGGAAA